MGMESSGFEFGFKPKEKKISTVLLDVKNNPHKHILFLSDIKPDKQYLFSFQTICKKIIPNYSYTIVLASKKIGTEELIKKHGIYRFYETEKSDFENYIQNETVVVSMGMAIQAITLNDNIILQDFYDFIFNRTYFYSPEIKRYVFPVDSWYTLFEQGNLYVSPRKSSKFNFFTYQLQAIDRLYPIISNPPDPPSPTFINFTSSSQIDSFFNNNSESKPMTWDIETDGLDFIHGKIKCFTCSFDGKTGYYLPFHLINIEKLDKFLSNKFQIGQNLKFDIKFLRSKGSKGGYIHSDTLILGQTLNEFRHNGLKSLAYYYTLYGGYDRNLDTYTKKNKISSYYEIPDSILIPYATMDSIVNFIVHEEQQKQLTEIDKNFPPPQKGMWTVRDYYEKIRLPAYRTFVDIEDYGIFVDMKKWDFLSDYVDKKIIELKKEIANKLGIQHTEDSTQKLFTSDTAIDSEKLYPELQSPKQLGEILEKLGWEEYGRSKAGYYLTGYDQLSLWEKNHPEATLIKELRSYQTLQKTFLGRVNSEEGWRCYIKKHPDGSYRIHPTYSVMGTESGRNSCRHPNYQQIPSFSIGSDLFKKIFTVPNPKEYYFVTLDYSSLQIKLAAIDTTDKSLIDYYKNNANADPHTKTGYSIFASGIDFEMEQITVTDEKGNTYVFYEYDKITVLRNGEKKEILAKDIQETDQLFPY